MTVHVKNTARVVGEMVKAMCYSDKTKGNAKLAEKVVKCATALVPLHRHSYVNEARVQRLTIKPCETENQLGHKSDHFYCVSLFDFFAITHLQPLVRGRTRSWAASAVSREARRIVCS